jgi:hypothetical protein
MEFGFFTLTACDRVLRLLANGEADSPASLTPFKIVGTFGKALRPAVYEDDIGPNTTVRAQHEGQYRGPLLVWTRLVRLTSRACLLGTVPTPERTQYLVRYHQHQYATYW